MDKKKILTLGGIFLVAIVCAFLILELFVPNVANVNNNNGKDEHFSFLESQGSDFIDVENILKEDVSNSDDSLSIKNIDSSYSDNSDVNETIIDLNDYNFDEINVANPEVYNSYMEKAEAHGYDISDLRNKVFYEGSEYRNNLENSEKISVEEIQFLNNLKNAADDYTLAYEEAITYTLSGDDTRLSNFVNDELSQTIENFKNLDTLGIEDLEDIKAPYVRAMEASKEGFYVLIEYPNTGKCNEYFHEADREFYNAQLKLEEYLVKIK